MQLNDHDNGTAIDSSTARAVGIMTLQHNR